MKTLANITHEQFVLRGEYKTALMKLAITDTKIPANTILGKVTKGAVTKAATVAPAGAGTKGANTGTGTLVMDGTAPIAANAEAGVYLVKCKAAASSGSAVFEVFNPAGGLMGETEAAVAGTTWNNRIKFVITDFATGGEDVAFAVGDAFAITVAITEAEGSGELVPWDPAATDGSEKAYAILMNDAPINVAAQYATVYTAGEFNAEYAITPQDVDVDVAYDDLRALGIHLTHPADEGKYHAAEAAE